MKRENKEAKIIKQMIHFMYGTSHITNDISTNALINANV